MGQKKVCIIVETEAFGGAEIHTGRLIRQLLECGYWVELVSCANVFYDRIVEELHDERLIYHRVDLSTTRFTSGTVNQWVEFLSTIESSILIIPKGWFWAGHCEFLKVCRRKFKKIYYIEHLAPDPMPKKSSREYWGGRFKGAGLWWFWEKWKRKMRSAFARRIVAVSDRVRDDLIRHCGYPSAKVIAVNNGVDTSHFKPDSLMGSNARNSWGIPDDAFVIGILARLSRVKGLDFALQGFQRFLEENPRRPVYLVIAGEGEELESLQALAKELNIENFVRFLGFVKDPVSVLCGYDVILFPSRNEGLPLALLEAMACECVPLVTDVGGMPGVVEDKSLGWVIEFGDVEALAKALSEVTGLKPEEFSKMKMRVRNHVRTRYNAAETYSQILKVLDL